MASRVSSARYTGAVLLFAVTCALVGGFWASLASAQSRTIVFLDFDASISDSGADVGLPDLGSDGELDASGGIIVEGVRAYPPPTPREAAVPQNDRPAILAQLTTQVKRCIATRTPDPGAANARFLYLVRDGRPHATLTTVTNAEAMYLDAFHARLIHAVGETRPIDLRTQEKMFRECVDVVTLGERPVRTERVSFRIKAGAARLRVLEVDWSEL